jgi:hypothetical protein
MTESALPSNVGTGTVVGKFVTAQKGSGGTPVTVPVAGKVTFTPTPAALLDAAAVPPATILPVPVEVTLDAAGTFSVDLVATDDTDLNPTGWNYRVTFAFTGAKYNSFNVNVPQGQTVDLATVAPVAAAGGTLITRGIGVPDTSGATTGDVLAVASDGTTAWVTPTGGTGGTVTSDSITDASTVGKAVLVAADAPTARGVLGAASAAQGALANTAVQPTRTVAGHALSADVVITPADIGAATTAQGAKADTAVQPAALTSLAPLASPTFTGTVSGITKSMVGLGSADNTADSAKNVLSATKLTTARTINGVSFDGTANVTVADSTKVPTTTTVNGHALSANVTVTAGDVGAAPYALASGASAIRLVGRGDTLPGTLADGDVFFLTGS